MTAVSCILHVCLTLRGSFRVAGVYAFCRKIATMDGIVGNVSHLKPMDVRPVTMEGQKFEIPEDPIQTLPERSRVDPV